MFMLDAIENSWSDTSKRTVIYFSFLLAREGLRKKDKTRNFRARLKELVSVESGDFDEIIQEFVFFGIMKSEETCELTEDALVAIESIIQKSMGDTEPVPFDGLQICQSKPAKRYDLWVKDGISYLEDLFGEIDDIRKDHNTGRFPIIEVGRQRGSIVLLQTDMYNPFIVMYFINTPRMKQMSELEPLLSATQEMIFQRIRLFEEQELQPTVNSLKAINIVAAPTYSTSTAHEAGAAKIPTKLLGPINLAILGKYFLKDRPCCRNEQYKALLTYLDPVKGGMRGGIVSATAIIRHLEKSLKVRYQQNGC